jgi:hypothetical protein
LRDERAVSVENFGMQKKAQKALRVLARSAFCVLAVGGFMDFRIPSPAHTGIATVPLVREAFIELLHEVSHPIMEQPETCKKTRVDGVLPL